MVYGAAQILTTSGFLAVSADTLVSVTLWTVAASFVVHGITAQPLMHRFLLRWTPRGRK